MNEVPLRHVDFEDPEGMIGREAEHLDMPLSRFVPHAVTRYLWLREQYAKGGRVLVEDERGLLREVRFPGSLK